MEGKKPSLKVTLTNKEKGYYSNLLMQADPTGTNKVGGQVGVAFFKRSGLAVDLLKNIWLTSARTSPEYLTRDEFYVALRLIAYAQNGIQANEDSIRFNIDVELPKFEAATLALPPAESREKPEIKAEDVAAALPDLDNLNLDALNGIQSLIPSIN
jgi:epidermal growth factor receptor substrate 15